MSMMTLRSTAVATPVGEIALEVRLPSELLEQADVYEIRLLAVQLAGVLVDDLVKMQDAVRSAAREGRKPTVTPPDYL